MKTTIFTDGSSRGNPGPGGWGAVIIANGKSQMISRAQVIEIGGGEENTTNNMMELTAAIKGLSHSPQKSAITVFTDSSYVINGITKWIKGWKKNGWRTKNKEDVLNKDLWMELDRLIGKHEVFWKYVGGHIGILGNERCDHIATAFADGMKIRLYKGPLSDYDLPDVLNIALDEAKHSKKASGSAHSRAKAYSYVSSVGGLIEIHHSWPECEKRVKGVSGARYKKALDAVDEARIMGEFSEL